MLAVTALGTLTRPRRALTTKMSEIVVDNTHTDSSAVDYTRTGVVTYEQDIVKELRQLMRSKNDTDRRFLSLARIKTAPKQVR